MISRSARRRNRQSKTTATQRRKMAKAVKLRRLVAELEAIKQATGLPPRNEKGKFMSISRLREKLDELKAFRRQHQQAA